VLPCSAIFEDTGSHLQADDLVETIDDIVVKPNAENFITGFAAFDKHNAKLNCRSRRVRGSGRSPRHRDGVAANLAQPPRRRAEGLGEIVDVFHGHSDTTVGPRNHHQMTAIINGSR
jgi:hypothetical protein